MRSTLTKEVGITYSIKAQKGKGKANSLCLIWDVNQFFVLRYQSFWFWRLWPLIGSYTTGSSSFQAFRLWITPQVFLVLQLEAGRPRDFLACTTAWVSVCVCGCVCTLNSVSPEKLEYQNGKAKMVQVGREWGELLIITNYTSKWVSED